MWELDCEESWALKNWCFWNVVLEKTLESPLDCKEIQPVHSEGDQPLDFFGRNDAKAETPVLWPPHAKSWLIAKDSDAGRDCRQEEKGTTEDEMAGWHPWLDGREPEWTPGVGDGQRGLTCCNSWGHKESDSTEWLNWTELNSKHVTFIQYSVCNLPGSAAPPCLQGGSVCDSTNSGWGGRQSFQKALNQFDYPVTLLFTCSFGFPHPRRGNETVGGRLPETREGKSRLRS